jgi:hypothetical protein
MDLNTMISSLDLIILNYSQGGRVRWDYKNNMKQKVNSKIKKHGLN